jgi:hypothetical protein
MVHQSRTTSPDRSRRGITILEVVFVITGVAMMLGLCAITLQLLIQLNADGQSRYSAAMALERLARQLREDVHACALARLTAVEKTPRVPAGLHLELEPGRTVDYRVAEGRVVRDESRAGTLIRHESYSLPRGRAARFEERKEAAHSLVALVLTQGPGKSGTAPPAPIEVVAAPGKDHRASRGGHSS